MEHVSLSIINLRTNKETALAAGQVFLNSSPEFQRRYEAWSDQLKTRFVESMLLNRATNPIWTVINEDDDSEEVLDGMHRLKTAASFLNNEFSLNKTFFMTLDDEKYNKKKFNDLSADDKARIRNYNFLFNKLDSSYRKDLNKLQDMYELLNRSSVTLTDYEFNKVILKPFYDIITHHKETFLKSGFFTAKDARGRIETEIIEMLILCFQLPPSWSSVSNLKEKWIKDHMGDTAESVVQYINVNGEELNNKLAFMTKIITDFYQLNLFSTDKRTFNSLFVPYKFIIVRCCYLIQNYALFNRIATNIIPAFKQEILVDDLQLQLECKSRNASFQRKVIEKIDEIIETELKSEGSTRRFTKKTILEKLTEQEHKCPKCKLDIKEGDDYEGDHIIPWLGGGKTIAENLQVLHKRCHQLKSA